MLWWTSAIAPRLTWMPFCAITAVGPIPSISLNATDACDAGAFAASCPSTTIPPFW